MKFYLVIIVSAFIFLGCATNKVEYDIDANLKSARKSMRVIKPESSDWCTGEQGCQYLATVSCGVVKGSKKKGKKSCKKKLKNKAAQLGGDLLLLQDRGMVAGQDEATYNKIHYRAYAQVYKCSEKNTELSQKYIAENGKPVSTPIKFIARAYHDTCKKPTSCEGEKKQNCSSIQEAPFDRCVEKLARQSNGAYNTIVLNNDVFNKFGAYRFFSQSYMCK